MNEQLKANRKTRETWKTALTKGEISAATFRIQLRSLGFPERLIDEDIHDCED